MQALQMRETKYTRSVREAMAKLGHATNAQIADMLRQEFFDLSDTTVHRVTARLLAAGELQAAPAAPDGSQRFDVNSTPHDHFTCADCGGLRDISVPAACREMIQAELGGCIMNGPLIISGNCRACMHDAGHNV